MSTFLYRLGRHAARRPWAMIGTWLVLAVAVVGASFTVGRDLDDDLSVPGLDSQTAIDLLEASESGEAGLTAQVVISPRDSAATFFGNGRARAELAEVQLRVAELPKVTTTTDPVGALAEGSDRAVASGTVSPDGRVALVRVQYPTLDELDAADLARLKAAVAASGSELLQVEAGGDLFFQFEQPEPALGEVAGLLVAIVILLVAFGSVVAAGLPIGTALLGLAVGISSLGLVTYVIDIPSYSTVMASMVGLGAGIDYALFVVTRHREHLAAGMPVDESVGRAVATAGKAVLFAGGTVVVSILGLAVAGIPFVTAAGVAISLVVLVMVAASVTLLPALLGAIGHGIDRLRLPGRRRMAAGQIRGAKPSRWSRWAGHVTRHPVAYGLAATLALLAMAAPVLALRLGVPDDGTLPESRTERRAYDMVAEHFGPGTNGPLLIAVDTAGDPTVVERLVAAIADEPEIAAVAPPRVDARTGVAAIVAIPGTAPQDEATRDTVERLRHEVFPEALAGTDASAHVGGQTANFADMSARVQSRLPWFIATVVVLSFLLLTVVFRSPLVALKAALLNLLSIGAAYGVLVMVFQWEWAGSLIGLEAAVPIVSFIPLLMFAIVFGLSMDYEVFLLSRMREHYDETGDNSAAVVHGLSSTARVITSAALIMVSVFLGFVFGEDPTVKMLGLGLATAIFVDATVVRMVLVPAAMTLMGDANWWLPRRLSRLVPGVELEPA